MATILGLVMSVVSTLLAMYQIVAKLFGFITVTGYTSTVASIWFVGGLILFVLGIIGLYIGRMFQKVKGRPLYIVKNLINV